MDLGLSGRVALVTGASAGLGFASAAALSKEGASVALFARDPARLAAAAGKLAANGLHCR
jgi:3-oxoacyl-[acyl-carrier protein] reductase